MTEPAAFYPGEQRRTIEPEPAPEPLRLLSLPKLLSMIIPPQPQLLAPILRERGTMMVHAKRGVGKTYLALGIAYAVACGGRYLRWEAPAARKVLYIDGEMPLVVLQERLAGIVAGTDKEAPENNFQILAADFFAEGLPNLAFEAGQAAIEPFLEGVGLLVLDNLSTLASTVRDNDADSWSPMQRWILNLKRRGVSVLLIQHSGKSGAQRGTSRKDPRYHRRSQALRRLQPHRGSPVRGPLREGTRLLR